MKMSDIVVWGMPGCSWCLRACELLTEHNLSFEYRSVGDEWTAQEFKEAAPGARTVPQIFINGKLIGGYTDLYNTLEPQ